MIPLVATSMFRPGWLWAAAAVWLATAVVGAAVMRRRGHDGFCWTLVFAAFGPLAVPLAVSAERRRPVDVPPADHPGALDVLVAVDPAAEAEANAAVDELIAVTGERPSSITLAAVVDYEAADTPRGREATDVARRSLEALASALRPRVSVPVDHVVLHGPPALALERFAADGGFELVVAGTHHRGTDPLGGRVGRHLARHGSVAVLTGPEPKR